MTGAHDGSAARWADRNSLLASRHVVASSHPAVSAVGEHVLADSGNAVDATLAMAAMSWIVLPGQCGIGGDAFAVLREPDGRVWTVGGSGFGPDGADPAFYTAAGSDAVPLRGALSVAVPGALGALAELHGRGGTRAITDLWRPAIGAAERGVACSVKTRDDVRAKRDGLSGDAGLAAMFLPGGEVPRPGRRLRFPDLARSIATLAEDPMSLYRGDFADRALSALVDAGAPFSGAEWELAARPEVGAPVMSRYHGMTVHQTPLPTPGWMVLQQLALCGGELSGTPYLGVDAVHRMATAARRSFADRWDRCASDDDAWRGLLDPETLARARAELDSDALAPVAGLRPDGDTTSTVAVDGEGRSVSFIHSLAFTFGAGISVPGTGIALNNRLGRGAYLVPGHPNEVRPRRKPLHTLNAWIVTDDENRLRHIGNTPGGDGQVQWNVQLISHLLDHGRTPQEAVGAPRFTVYPGSDADTVGQAPELRVESRFDESTVGGLRQRGHEVRELGPWDAGGSALVVSRDPDTGSLIGGADPRQDGVVLGE